MSLILIVSAPEATVSLKRILQGHDLIVASEMQAALVELGNKAFDAIMVDLHFDRSRMFEFMRKAKTISKNATTPIMCYCARNTEMTQHMRQSLKSITRFLGAWMYLDEHEYNVFKDPDEEVRHIIDRCLIGEARKWIQQERIGVQKKRAELHELRLILPAQKWLPAMKTYLKQELRSDMESLFHKAEMLRSLADGQRAKVEASRNGKDRVAEDVTMNENWMTQMEDIQSSDEARQQNDEEELVKTQR